MHKIIIVEDEPALAKNIEELLLTLGYDVCGVFSDAKSCLDFLSCHTADLVLLDISINGNENGIALGKQIKAKYNLPVVFCTAHSDYSILQQIDTFKSDGYIVKPFTLAMFRATLFLALNKNNNTAIIQNNEKTFNVRDKGLVVPLETGKIIIAKADGLYTKIITEDKSYLVRDILKNIESKLIDKRFIRVHKSYLINIDHINSYNSKLIKINQTSIPIRRGFYKTLQSIFDKKAE